MSFEYTMNERTLWQDYRYEHSCLTNLEIDRIRDIFESNKDRQTKGFLGDGHVREEVRRSSLLWWNEEFNNALHTTDTLNKIVSHIDEINKRHFKFDLFFTEELQITKYDESEKGHYVFHVDDNYQFQTNVGRKLSFVIQLSDPNEFEGGDFIIKTPNGEIDVGKHTPQAIQKGSVIVFPSFVTHAVKPVTKGIRYSLVGWCHGPRFR